MRHRKFGLTEHGEGVWWYRIPESGRRVRIECIILNRFGQRSIIFGQRSIIFRVNLIVKHSPKYYSVEGDLLDAMAKAAEIIHTPPKNHYSRG